MSENGLPHEIRTNRLAENLMGLVRHSNELDEPEDAPEPAAAAESKAEAAPAKSGLDDSLVRQARELGLSDKAIESFGNSDGLRETLTAIYKRGAQPQQQQVQTPAPEKPKRERTRLSFDGMELDEGLVKKIKEFEDLTYKEQDELAARLDEAHASIQRMNADRTAAEAYRAINSLPQQYRKYYGESVDESMTPDSPEGKNVTDTAALAGAIMQNYERMGRRISVGKAISIAANTIFGGNVEQDAREKVREEVKDRSTQHIPRPGGVRRDEPEEDDPNRPLTMKEAARRMTKILERAGAR